MVTTRPQQRQRKKPAASSATAAGGTFRLTAAVVGAALLLVLFLVPHAQGFQVPTQMSAGQDRPSSSWARMERRQALAQGALAAAGIVGLGLARPPAAQALVKGNAPPPDMRKAKMGEKPKAANMEDARALGRQKEEELFNKGDEGSGYETTKDGDRYRDIVVGSGGKALADGDTCAIRYRALRLGKRSRDGLSGEASTVFSFGYGEDDDKDGDEKEVTLGKSNLIPALSAGLVGMRVGGKRRILVRPERGWFKGDNCGALDDTDINNLAANFIVPGTKIDARDDCFDLTRVPSPQSYAARRRMGRRFDESLIVEVEVVR